MEGRKPKKDSRVLGAGLRLQVRQPVDFGSRLSTDKKAM